MRIAFRTRRPRLLIAGGVAAFAALLVLMRPSEAPVPDLAPAPAMAAAPAPAPMPVAAPPAAVAASTAGLQLKGVLGFDGAAGAAIFGLADGRQRLVAVGREVTPGVRLEAIGTDRATVYDGVQRLDLLLPELQATGTAAPAATAPAAVATPTPTPTSVAAIDPKRDLANFRLGLKPEGDPKQPRGYRVAGGVPLPMLDRAGLRPGDVVLSVNGQSLDEERLLELPAELLAASSVEIEFERAGKRQRAIVPTR